MEEKLKELLDQARDLHLAREQEVRNRDDAKNSLARSIEEIQTLLDRLQDRQDLAEEYVKDRIKEDLSRGLYKLTEQEKNRLIADAIERKRDEFKRERKDLDGQLQNLKAKTVPELSIETGEKISANYEKIMSALRAYRDKMLASRYTLEKELKSLEDSNEISRLEEERKAELAKFDKKRNDTYAIYNRVATLIGRDRVDLITPEMWETYKKWPQQNQEFRKQRSEIYDKYQAQINDINNKKADLTGKISSFDVKIEKANQFFGKVLLKDKSPDEIYEMLFGERVAAVDEREETVTEEPVPEAGEEPIEEEPVPEAGEEPIEEEPVPEAGEEPIEEEPIEGEPIEGEQTSGEKFLRLFQINKGYIGACMYSAIDGLTLEQVDMIINSLNEEQQMDLGKIYKAYRDSWDVNEMNADVDTYMAGLKNYYLKNLSKIIVEPTPEAGEEPIEEEPTTGEQTSGEEFLKLFQDNKEHICLFMRSSTNFELTRKQADMIINSLNEEQQMDLGKIYKAYKDSWNSYEMKFDVDTYEASLNNYYLKNLREIIVGPVPEAVEEQETVEETAPEVEEEQETVEETAPEVEEEPKEVITTEEVKELKSAIKIMLEERKISIALLQMKMKKGYAAAARIVDRMEELGIVGPFAGSKPREILMTGEQLTDEKIDELIMGKFRQESIVNEEQQTESGIRTERKTIEEEPKAVKTTKEELTEDSRNAGTGESGVKTYSEEDKKKYRDAFWRNTYAPTGELERIFGNPEHLRAIAEIYDDRASSGEEIRQEILQYYENKIDTKTEIFIDIGGVFLNGYGAGTPTKFRVLKEEAKWKMEDGDEFQATDEFITGIIDMAAKKYGINKELFDENIILELMRGCSASTKNDKSKRYIGKTSFKKHINNYIKMLKEQNKDDKSNGYIEYDVKSMSLWNRLAAKLDRQDVFDKDYCDELRNNAFIAEAANIAEVKAGPIQRLLWKITKRFNKKALPAGEQENDSSPKNEGAKNWDLSPEQKAVANSRDARDNRQGDNVGKDNEPTSVFKQGFDIIDG